MPANPYALQVVGKEAGGAVHPCNCTVSVLFYWQSEPGGLQQLAMDARMVLGCSRACS